MVEATFPKFFDLVIWGHEHESMPEVYECGETGVSFLQPGSTVMTSLIEAESKPKHCFLLKVKEQAYNLRPIEL